MLRDVLAPQSSWDGAAEFSSSNLISQVCFCSPAALGEEQAGNSLAVQGLCAPRRSFPFQRDAPGMEEGEERHHHSPAALDTVMNPKLSPNPRISRNFGQGKHPHQKICREILSIITQNNMKYAPKKKISALLCITQSKLPFSLI